MKHAALTTIRKEFSRSSEARYIHRLHGVFLVLSGLSSVQVGKLLREPGRTVAHWVKRFRQHGLKGLEEAEKSGRPKSLTAQQQKGLKAALMKSPKDTGLSGDSWTGELVSQFLRRRFHIKLTMRHCRRILRKLESERL